MNKHEQMGYGPVREYTGTDPDLQQQNHQEQVMRHVNAGGDVNVTPDGVEIVGVANPLPASNNGSFNQMADAANEAATHEGEWQLNADHETALKMDEARTQELIEQRIIAPRDPESNQPSVQELNDAAEIAIFGSRGKTAGFVDADGNPITEPIKGKIDEILESPRYGTKEADRKEAAEKYQADVEALVGEGFELTQAKLIMDSREARANSIEARRRMVNKDFNDKMNMLVNQGMTNGQTRAQATKAAKERLGARGIKEFKAPTKAELKKADKEFKSFVKKEGIFSTEDLITVLNGGSLYGAQVSPEQEDDPTTIHNPVVDPTPRGLRARARHLMARAALAMHNSREWFNDDEKGKRRKAGAAVAGALVVAGAAYLALKTGTTHNDVDGGNSANGLDPNVNPDGSFDIPTGTDATDPGGTEYTPGQEGTTTTPADVYPSGASTASHETVTMQHGDTIWDLAQLDLIDHGNSNPSNLDILNHTQEILDANDISWEEARSLADGTKIKI